MGCSLMVLVIPVSQSTGGAPFVWSYKVDRLSASALSDDGERFLIGCNNGEYFVFDQYGNLILNRTFEQEIHSVDIADNGSMIFGLESGAVFVDSSGSIQSKEYFTEPVLYVSATKDGAISAARKSIAVAANESEVAIGTEGGTLSLYTIEGKKEFSIPQPGSSILKAFQGAISFVAFDSFLNGTKEFERENFKNAKGYFESAIRAFEEYKFDRLDQQSHTFLERIREFQIDVESGMRKYRLAAILSSWAISSGIIYMSLKRLQDMMYRNENHSTLDSLLYTFHTKKFPEFSGLKNPYYAGNPVKDPSMFFGRESIHEFLKVNLASPGRNPSIIFHGERKTGKTSILFQIEDGKLNLGPEFIPVYIDMNGMVTNDDYEFLSRLASLIQEAVSNRIQMSATPLEKEGNPFLLFRDNFLRKIVNSIGKKRILFLVDEYESIERKITDGKLSKDILNFLKSLSESEIELDFIFAGSRKIEDLKYSDEWSYALGASKYRKISFLKREDAIRLIKDPVVQVWYTNRAVEKILEFSGCHPYILQYFCFNLITLLYDNESYTVDIKEVDEVIRDIVENPMHQMEYLWKRLSKNQKLLVSFLAEVIQKEGDSIGDIRLIDEFKEKNIKSFNGVSTILKDLEDLERNDILKREEYRYSFCADIFRQFVLENHPP